MLCPACDVARFPQYVKSSAGEVKDTPCTSDGTPCSACAPLYAKLQQQMSELWNAHRKLAADVIEIKRVADNMEESGVKSDEHVKLVAEVSEIKTVVSRFSEEQHADIARTEELNLSAKVCKTVNDINKRKKNVVVTGLPEVDMGTTGTSSDESKRLDEVAFTIFCEENLTVKPAVSKLGCRRLGKATGTKPRRLLVHLSSEQNAQDLLSSARALLRKSSDHYVASTIYFNPDLTAAEAKLAFEQRQKRRAAKILEQGNGTTSAETDTNTTVATALSQAMTSTSTTVPINIKNSDLSAGAASWNPAPGLKPCV